MAELNVIGETAGNIYRYLNQHGPSSLNALIRSLPVPSRTTYMAIGWLAREGKIDYVQDKRAILIRSIA